MSVTSLGTTDSPAPGEASAGAVDGQTDLHVVAEAAPSQSRRSPAYAPVLVGLVVAVIVALTGSSGRTPVLCALVWAAVVALQVAFRPRRTSIRSRVVAELKTGTVLVSLVSLASLADVVGRASARWSVVVLVAAVASGMAAGLLQRRPSRTRRIVLVGSQSDIESYAGSVRGLTDVVVVGCLVADAVAAHAVPSIAVPTTTSLETLPDFASSVDADTVLVLPGRDTDTDLVRRLTWKLQGSAVTVGVLTPVSAVSPHRLGTSELANRTVLELGAVSASRVQTRAKGVIDRVGAALILVCVAPLMLALVAAVRLDSRGPGLFVQTRVGRDGELFRMFKLRTMFTDAESMKQALLEDNESDGVLFKIRRDPRVTRFGYWLRRSSLDELPQLLNVLRGEMSLVGPRPALPSEVASYDDVAARRLVVKPGITGLWQVSGRSDLLWDESLRLDLYYADNWRVVDDFVIAARTVSAVTMARGAY
jgi:exopolysaccharide biosynthesis polyprenyl glycosylphosphotransferase